jgi:hypothetical protein
MRSENTNELAAALAKAQATIAPPKKGHKAEIKSDKGSYGYSYADLADVIECYRKPLSDNGLAVAQTMAFDDGHITLITTLLHSSGQWISSEYPVASFQRAQEQGSAITYARRYSVTALLGIAAEDDDDGAAASEGKREERSAPATGPASGDAALILELAKVISGRTGRHPDDVIKDASKFTKDGKEFFFTDPRKKAGNTKWLASTLARMSKENHSLHADEPGASEAAAEFTEMFGGPQGA